MNRSSALLCGALFAGAALTLGGGLTSGLSAGPGPALPPACLDVSVPPGLPFEWEQPARQPTGSLALRKPEEPGDPGATRVRRTHQVTSRPRVYAEKTTAMAYARVTTVDILNHFSWTEGPQTDQILRPSSGRPVTGSELGAETAGVYPPDVPIDLYWVTFAHYLREVLHPNQVSDAESLERLVEIGFPAMCVIADLTQQQVGNPGPGAGMGYVTNAAAAKARIQRWKATLAKRVGPLPSNKPRAAADKTSAERTMLLRLAADDLASGYASSVDATYAARLLTLPDDEGLQLLLPYARPSSHPLLLRNAVSLLGAYSGKAAQGALERVLASSKDDVARLRAYMALARQNSPEAKRIAVAQYRAVEASAAVNVLGLLRAPEGSKIALKLLKRGTIDGKMTAIRALGRIGDKDKKVLKALERALKGFKKANPKKLYEVPAFKADVPDTIGIRRDILGQLCVIALARLGDADNVKTALKLANTAPPAPQGPNRGFRRQAVAAPGTFGLYAVPTLAFFVESLEFMGKEAEPILLRIVADKVCDTGLRLAAWRSLDRRKVDTKDLAKSLAETDRVGAVRAAALGRWADHDLGGACARATKVVKEFSPLGTSSSSLEVIEAADVLAEAARKGKASTAREVSVRMRGGKIYTEPKATSKLVMALPIGRVTVFGEPAKGWIRMRYLARGKTYEGWVEAKYLLLTAGKSVDALLADTLILAKRKPKPKPAPKKPNDPAAARRNGNPVLEVAYPLAEAIARALSRYDTAESRKALIDFLHDDDQPASARGAAAAALASSKHKEAKAALAKALTLEDGWVRYCAFRSLRHMGAEVPFVDWVYGSEQARAKATQALQAWAK